MNRRPSDAEDLRAVAVHAVRMYLELEAGRRAAATMTGLASPHAAEQLEAAAGRHRDSRTARIQRITVQRPARDRADIAAAVRHPDHSVTAVTMHLHQIGRRWQITDVAHLERGRARSHAHETAGELPPTLERVARRFDIAALLGAADAATREASTAESPEAAARARTRAAEWRGRADRLTRSLAEPPPAPQPPDRTGAGRPAAKHYQEALLGPRPDDGPARESWSVAAGLLDGYRRRWNITDPITPLGPVPPHGDQRDDRQATLRHISRIVRDFTTPDRSPRIRPREHGPGLAGP